MLTTNQTFERRRQRTRAVLRKTGQGRPRLSVHRSSKHIRAQVIDDTRGITLATASTLDPEFRKLGKTGADVDAATFVGTQLAQRAQKNGVKRVVFDRGGFMFHGRVKALADAAREAGLEL